MIVRSQYLSYIRLTVMTLCLWFGIPPVISDGEDLKEIAKIKKYQNPDHQRNIVHVPAKFQILDMYFDSLLEHSLDDIEEHSAKATETSTTEESLDRDL